MQIATYECAKFHAPIQLELPNLDAHDSLRCACNWLLQSPDLRCEDATRKMHADHCRYLLKWFGDASVRGLTYVRVLEYVRSELRRGISVETVRKRVSTLNMILREALAHGVIDRVPETPVLRQRRNPKAGYWTRTQWEAVHLACDADDDFRTWIAVNWHLGMHPSDTDRFRWSDVDLVRKTWNRRNTKVHAEPAELPLPDRLCQILRERKQLLQPHPRDLVCGRRMGYPNRELRALAERAGVPSVCPLEAGRHSAETYLEESGASELFQMTWLGLKSPAMLKRTYRHWTPKTLEDGIAAVNSR